MPGATLTQPLQVVAHAAAPVPTPATSPVAGAHDEDHGFAFDVVLVDGYRQFVNFGLPGVPPLVVDEPPPLGELTGPNPARVLGAALATCLGASLLYCLRKAHVEVRGLRTHVDGEMTRNQRGRLRIGSVRVRLEPVVPAEQHERVPRCLTLFEDFCVVTASVRPGVRVDVEVVPASPAGG